MSVVDDVKARLDILDVVSGYVNLQKAGRNYKAPCPFHQERTPSFIVFPDTQTWRCFGACGEGGDIFGFVMKAEGWDFAETLRELAKRAGVELTPRTPDQQQHQAENERLYGLIEETARFFHQQLTETPQGEFARNYVARRGLNEQTIKTFVLGYAPDDWRQALQHLQMLGYQQDEIIEAGVAIRSEKGSVYDRFRHRLIVPIRDGRGRTVGFGARALRAEDTPKYLNSPQGPLFDKSHLLFGLDMARRVIRESETAVIVEGYMDAIQAHQGGFLNVVAQMGTALTEEQLRQLERYATRLILALDPDAAGVNATMRGLNVARQTLDGEERVTFDPRGMMRYTGTLNMDIRVVSLPDGQDPDDLIRDHPEAWESLIAGAVPVADYVIQQGTIHLNERSSYQEREKAARELLPILTATESDLQRSGNIQTLARRVHIDERTLLQWALHRRAVQTRPAPALHEQRRLARPSAAQVAAASSTPSAQREGFCLRLLLEQPDRLYSANRKLRELQGNDGTLASGLASLNAEDFSRPDYQAVFRLLLQALYQDDLEPVDYFNQHLSPELSEAVALLPEPGPVQLRGVLPKALTAELLSVMRDQERLNTLPEPTTPLFVEEALALRYRRLERESNEVFFLQQDAQLLEGGLPGQYATQIEANRRARELIQTTLRQMRTIARD
ncbi:MAG: DNA primase [Chloroflexi bacterium]|nr:DNA primase [Chloroflexota bacterium]